MGKKNKKNKSEPYGYWDLGSGGRDEGKTLKRYGIDERNYASSGAIAQGRVHGKKSTKEMGNDVVNAARSDYHTNRAIEAAAMSGDKKAQKFAKRGIANVSDLMKVQEMQRKQHKELGNGGDFSSASDFAGLSYGFTQKDRQQQDAGYDEKYATKSALQEMQDKLKEEATGTAGEPEISQALEEAATEITSYEDELSSFGDLIAGTAGENDLELATEEASNETSGASENAQNFKDQYASVVNGGLKLSNIETRGPRSGIRPGEGF